MKTDDPELFEETIGTIGDVTEEIIECLNLKTEEEAGDEDSSIDYF